jgi:hypothetical protein
MDRVYGGGPWVYGIVNQFRLLIRRWRTLIYYTELLFAALIRVAHVGFNGSEGAPTGSGGGRIAHDGASAAPHRRSSSLLYGGQVSMRFGPMALQWWGETVFAHLERQRSMVAAEDDGTIRVVLGDNRSLL